jgi:hypothetical protein
MAYNSMTREKERQLALKFLAELRHKASGDTLTRIALNSSSEHIANILNVPVQKVSVYPFKEHRVVSI